MSRTHIATRQGAFCDSPLRSTETSAPLLTVDVATAAAVGVVKPDGTSVKVAADGTLSTATAGAYVSGSNQSVVPSTPTTFSFSTLVKDDGGFADLTNHPDRLTVPVGKAGWYIITAGILYPASSGGSVIDAEILVNGAGLAARAVTQDNPASGFTGPTIALVYYLNDGDYVGLQSFQNTTTNPLKSSSHYLSMAKL